MSTATREWARKRRARLIETLGSKCAACGSELYLELDLVVAPKNTNHGNGSLGRLCFYIRQWRMGNVRLLCGSCNRMKAAGLDAEFWSKVIKERRGSESSTTIKHGEQLQQQRKALTPRELHS
jgi:5-methylcytosine-specific restriction endonuclease McrA